MFLAAFPDFMIWENLNSLAGDDLVDLLIEKTTQCLHMLDRPYSSGEAGEIMEELNAILSEIRSRKKKSSTG